MLKRNLPGIAIAILIVLFVGYAVLTKPVKNISMELDINDTTFSSLDSLATKQSAYLYGINIDNLDVIEGTVQRNQNLSGILSQYNVSYTTIDQLARNFKDVFDVRKLAANRKYTVLLDQDSLKTARMFVYEPNSLEYVVFNLLDSMDVYRESRKVDTVIQNTAGIISSSLYNAMIGAGATPALANNLSDVYAWQIDFFRIQKDDKFKVIYEQYLVDGEPVGTGRILAAFFEHSNNPFYAFFYDQDGSTGYFDDAGKSLRKAFLKAPLNYSRISSRFSNSRFHPVLKVSRPHHGVDYAAPTGTPVQSIGDGVVEKANFEGGNGNYVRIKHNSVYTTGYLHLSKFGPGIRPGVRVKQGQVIGYVGTTGLSTGPHLCFRVWMNGKPVNPLTIQSPPSEPIKNDHRESFELVMRSKMMLLNQIDYVFPDDMPVARDVSYGH
jgi:murein DD-endopeptidase MepM/ murein hydrolase activator NlpD